MSFVNTQFQILTKFVLLRTSKAGSWKSIRACIKTSVSLRIAARARHDDGLRFFWQSAPGGDRSWRRRAFQRDAALHLQPQWPSAHRDRPPGGRSRSMPMTGWQPDNGGLLWRGAHYARAANAGAAPSQGTPSLASSTVNTANVPAGREFPTPDRDEATTSSG